MADLNVSIKTLPGMWVASVHASGDAPETEAWRRLCEWATRQGLWSDFDRHPVFGFNNPAPSSSRKGYGYELWIRVDRPMAGEDAMAFKEFEGGLFATAVCKLHDDPDIGTTWRMLWDWAQAGPHRWRRSQELEKVLNPDAAVEELVLELYLPIE